MPCPNHQQVITHYVHDINTQQICVMHHGTSCAVSDHARLCCTLPRWRCSFTVCHTGRSNLILTRHYQVQLVVDHQYLQQLLVFPSWGNSSADVSYVHHHRQLYTSCIKQSLQQPVAQLLCIHHTTYMFATAYCKDQMH